MTVDPEADILAYGKTATIVVKIDRKLLASGNNEAIIVVRSTSGGGNVEIKVSAIGEYRAESSLNTLEATEVTNTSAVLNGEIINPGAPAYTERGFVWHTQDSPTLLSKLGSISVPVTDEKRFSWCIENLVPTTTYYVRAYLVQNGKVIYGNTITIGTSQQETTITTSAATSVGATSATLNATIADAGIPAYTERGFCYSKYGDPTIADNRKAVTGTGTGDYQLQVSGLEYPITYYVRAYVIQSGKPVYGNTVTFTTVHRSASISASAVSSVTATEATFNASISDVGEPAYTERGFCYNTTGEPTIANNKKMVSGTGTGNYSLQVAGLEYPVTYYVRAYVMQSGVPVYSNEVTFTTNHAEVSVMTSAATMVGQTSARMNGSITNVGMPAYTQRGFCYSPTNTTPTTANSKVTEYTSLPGSFYKDLSELDEGTTYYVRAFAVQDGVTVYGNTVNFTTHAAPIVRTNAVTALTPVDLGAGIIFGWNATFNGSVLFAGNPVYTQRGFVYGEHSNPTVGSDTSVKVSGSGTGAYSATVSNLANYKIYYVRAYVKTADGYVYGENVSFSTMN